MSRRLHAIVVAWMLPCALAHAAEPPPVAAELDTVQVVGQRIPLQAFPGAVDVVDGRALREAQRAVNLSESLSRVPGLGVRDRNNYAQDLQVQSRGFGARATFGVRGVHLEVEGIPASALDGQGQAASFPLGMLDRIQVLRGPLALQYGNASGGVILGQVDLAEREGVAGAADAWAGSDASRRASLRLEGGGRWRWRLLGSDFATDGPRAHAAAKRRQFSTVAETTMRGGGRLRVAFDQLSQPETDDPLGLTPAQWRADPGATHPLALRFDTRKAIDHRQLGLRWEHGYAAGRDAWLGAYAVDRDVLQFLAIPPVAQRAASHAGGVIDLGRQEVGIEAGHRWSGNAAALALGVQAGRLDEHRRGHENFMGTREGVRGRLRRDERNRMHSQEAFAVGQWTPAPRWSVLGGARQVRLRVRSEDRFLANGDDGGRLGSTQAAGSLGIARAFGRGEAFASVGRGFETPTLNEIAYRPDGGAGLNTALQPSRNNSFELGARWRAGGQAASVAAYRIDARDEIVAAAVAGGRSSFTNAGRTRRVGIEVGADGSLGRGFGYALAASWIRARFVDGFGYRMGGQQVQVPAGNRVPGIPRAEAWAELSWRAGDDRRGLALEARGNGAIAVDDRNSTVAPGSLRLALRGDWRWSSGWRAFARIDNLLDRDYVGSVIVNDGNQRWFEPGAGRGFTLGIGRDFGR